MPPIGDKPVDAYIQDLIRENKIAIFSKTTCPYCTKVKQLFDSLNEKYAVVELDKLGNA